VKGGANPFITMSLVSSITEGIARGREFVRFHQNGVDPTTDYSVSSERDGRPLDIARTDGGTTYVLERRKHLLADLRLAFMGDECLRSSRIRFVRQFRH